MGDFVWFIIIGILFILLAFVFGRLGWLIWKKQKMDLIISHHCDKVSEANKPAYCTLAGVGVFVMGVGFGLSGVCMFLTQSALTFIPMAAGLVVGVALLIMAIRKYNR